MGILRHLDQTFEYEIERKPAVTRRIHLHARPDGGLKVVAPLRMSQRDIHRSLQQMAPRVAKFLVTALARQQEVPDYRYITGEQHLYLGEQYPLVTSVARGRRGSVQLRSGNIEVTAPDEESTTVRKKLLAWYRQQAMTHFSARIRDIAETAWWVSGEPPPLRLRNMKRTWGSCSSRGVITLNPRMLKAPGVCIDYVIAHELCHLVEMNHGKAFYALQEALYPEWRSARAHLRAQAHVYLV